MAWTVVTGLILGAVLCAVALAAVLVPYVRRRRLQRRETRMLGLDRESMDAWAEKLREVPVDLAYDREGLGSVTITEESGFPLLTGRPALGHRPTFSAESAVGGVEAVGAAGARLRSGSVASTSEDTTRPAQVPADMQWRRAEPSFPAVTEETTPSPTLEEAGDEKAGAEQREQRPEEPKAREEQQEHEEEVRQPPSPSPLVIPSRSATVNTKRSSFTSSPPSTMLGADQRGSLPFNMKGGSATPVSAAAASSVFWTDREGRAASGSLSRSTSVRSPEGPYGSDTQTSSSSNLLRAQMFQIYGIQPEESPVSPAAASSAGHAVADFATAAALAIPLPPSTTSTSTSAPMPPVSFPRQTRPMSLPATPSYRRDDGPPPSAPPTSWAHNVPAFPPPPPVPRLLPQPPSAPHAPQPRRLPRPPVAPPVPPLPQGISARTPQGLPSAPPPVPRPRTPQGLPATPRPRTRSRASAPSVPLNAVQGVHSDAASAVSIS
ncbi:hypothetical protein PUNSTDRAFT_118735 [Punctularia strigosozonata HHB-11173 SS5]|uniref:uncharacterized protein n=1 Tax=Punctularia strigosozonata (strain HHB-11173) TaxID=741275 RepID=UPI00044169D7|nr:uncharacterized protein PUNSTDRAFT_118735 [Punctularia strigosozonata HHB-11173 SS5]EIN11236.1 hypothetical protein PUNSTDRAFT_118735 [Punctularia strigosozonata HHB-11173 SS5]